MIDRILLDMDGVIADFMGGACELHGKRYEGHPHNPSTQQFKTPWDIEPLFGMSSHDLWSPMGRDFWANLRPLPWAAELVNLLEERFGEDHICILTSPVRTDGCIDGKMDWIRKHFPQYKRRFLAGPAKEFCASPRHCLVDDHEKNIEAFKDANGHGLLIPAPWNRRFGEHPIIAVKEWLAALNTLGKS